MTGKWKIVYSETSRNDLFAISDYIKYDLQSPQSAKRITNKIIQTIAD